MRARHVSLGGFVWAVVLLCVPTLVAGAPRWSAWGPGLPDPGRNPLYGMASLPDTGGSNVWAVGGKGVILNWDGTVWKLVPSPTAETLRSVVIVRTNFGIAVGEGGAILMWNGSEWRLADAKTDSWFRSVAFTPGGANDEAWAAGDKASIGMCFKWTGSVWTNKVAGQNQMFSGTGWGVSMVSPTDGWLVGERLKSTGTGLAWQGQILRWNGSKWNDTTSPTNKLYCVQMLSPTDGWIAGQGGLLLRWDGAAWNDWGVRPRTQDLWAVSFLTSSNGWAVGNAGAIVRWDGTVWTGVTSPTTLDLRGVTAISASEAWAVGVGGVILRWNGSAWQTHTAPAVTRLTALAITPDSGGRDAWAVGEGRSIYHWDGSTWQSVAGPSTSYYDVSMLSPSNGWIAGPGGRFHRWDGVNWSEAGRWQSGNALTLLSSNLGWAVGWGKIQRWDGSNWTQLTSPTTRTLYGVHAVNASDLWAVGEGGTILHGDGNAWSAVTSPVTDWLTSVSLASANEGWAVGNYGVILRWNGANWLRQTNTPSSPLLRGVSVTPSHQGTVGWAVGAGGGVFGLSNGVWSAGSSRTANDLWAVEMASPTEAWAVGEHGVILHWADPNVPESLSIRILVDGQIELNWSSGILEASSTLHGGWTPVAGGETPPHRITLQETARFFRTRR